MHLLLLDVTFGHPYLRSLPTHWKGPVVHPTPSFSRQSRTSCVTRRDAHVRERTVWPARGADVKEGVQPVAEDPQGQVSCYQPWAKYRGEVGEGWEMGGARSSWLGHSNVHSIDWDPEKASSRSPKAWVITGVKTGDLWAETGRPAQTFWGSDFLPKTQFT